jgi:hypothetical protein
MVMVAKLRTADALWHLRQHTAQRRNYGAKGRRAMAPSRG